MAPKASKAGRFGPPEAQPQKKGGGGSKKKKGQGGGKGKGKGSGQSDADEHLTNPALISEPPRKLIDSALEDSWKLHPENGMALIFDTISPARQYNRDQPYHDSEESRFAVYDPDPEQDNNVTENDSETDPLNPYEPIVVQ